MTLFHPPRLSSAENDVLGKVRQLWVELRSGLGTHPTKWTGILARDLRARAIRGSNAIEGFRVTREDALAIVDGERAEESDSASERAVTGYREAMDYVLRLSSAADFQYSADLLRSLHFMMTRHSAEAHPGTWRPGQNYVIDEATRRQVYTAPPVELVPALITELATQLSAADGDSDTRMLRAAMAHLNLVMIHPFSDGNGRMARCLQTLVLARGGVLAPTFSSIEEYLGHNTLAYYSVLAKVGGESWGPKRDSRPWIRFCLTAHYQQAKSVKSMLDRTALIGEDVESEVHRLGLPERSVTPLVNAALGERIRNAAYRQHADVTMPVASRDLAALVQAGLLKKQGDKRGTTYAAAERLLKLAAKYPTAPVAHDPFARK